MNPWIALAGIFVFALVVCAVTGWLERDDVQ